jgi:hypothetical protein
VTGFGVHWNCTARRGERSCSLACFDDQGPEYLVSFEHNARQGAIGRTVSRAETIGAVGAWLDGHEIEHLHKRFAFVDRYKGEFITSWDWIEHFFEDARFPCAGQVLGLIARIRQAGYDKTLRAGQSLWSLVVSRCRRHGLREDQPSIEFWFRGNGMDIYSTMDGQESLSVRGIEFSPQVDDLLNRIATKVID